MAIVDSLPAFVELLAAQQPKDAETVETVDLLRQVVQMESAPGGLLYDDGTSFELRTLRRPLQAYIFARENPTAAVGVPIAGVLLLVGVGVLIGRWSK